MTQDPRPEQDGVGGPPEQADTERRELDPERREPDTGRDDTDRDDTETATGGATAALRPRRRRHPVGRFVREVLLIGTTALVISFLIKTFLVQAFWIPSGSMEDTLVYGDRVLVSKLQVGPTEIERGDIAVFHDPGGWLPPAEDPDRGALVNGVVDLLEFVGLAPAGDGDHLIKRVIGIGGDRVVCCDDQGRVTVNDVPLEEPYLFPGDEPSTEQFDVTVPRDHFWVMGDHRSNSRDSRANDDGTGTGGSVPADNIVGQALVLVWPLDRFDWFSRPAEVFDDVPVAGGTP